MIGETDNRTKEEIEREEETKAWNVVVDGVVAFEKQQAEEKDIMLKPMLTPPKIEGGSIIMTIKIPIKWIKKYTGEFDKGDDK